MEAGILDQCRDAPPMVLKGHSQNVTSVEFATDSTLVTGGIGDEIVVWLLDSGEELSRLGGTAKRFQVSPHWGTLGSGRSGTMELSAAGQGSIGQRSQRLTYRESNTPPE